MRDRRGESGAALVEFALVVTLLLTLLIGTLTYGLVLGLHQSVTHTASAAARAAVVTPPEAIAARVAAVGDQQLAWLGARGALATVTPVVGACPGSAATCVTVTVTYPYGEAPLIPSFLGLPTPETITSTAVLELEAA